MNHKLLNISLWIAQTVIALMLLMAGIMKLIMPIQELSKTLAWTADMSNVIVRLLGVIDVAGSIGILFPAMLRIKPELTGMTAIGIILLMSNAIAMHLSRGELSVIGMNICILLLATFVYWGRTRKAVILPPNR